RHPVPAGDQATGAAAAPAAAPGAGGGLRREAVPETPAPDTVDHRRRGRFGDLGRTLHVSRSGGEGTVSQGGGEGTPGGGVEGQRRAGAVLAVAYLQAAGVPARLDALTAVAGAVAGDDPGGVG